MIKQIFMFKTQTIVWEQGFRGHKDMFLIASKSLYLKDIS